MYSILYVDDEPIIRDLISLFLPKFGEFSIDLAEDPDTGLIMHQEKKYDAIISDFDMPGSNGITFLINLRSTGDKTPFILFTGKSREEIAVEALNWGADHYLHKGGGSDQFRELAHVTIHAIQRHQSIEEVKRSSATRSSKSDCEPGLKSGTPPNPFWASLPARACLAINGCEAAGTTW
ncbi:response regulator receiver domain protein (CheY-like) [Methanospirillum hungatei JF-1]|uniref:Response regulator receiver domain protein (CheY-like) n=1 Tax=Methanospirillum hungatei JF-1 (strain ATCC 27890 / DSM 864 / NBRC 100397 / JF-1) TaxID=323259 RepID=Q2FLR5_METHJ|nr:response regulator [Methanospirillum hungatei]ABD40035.1 response regulator receiver domain protein (CheY-like) [Methanospirillum hungatei JF-1]